jgi:predicted GH43/DUF377 family glycosyl hydrolase
MKAPGAPLVRRTPYRLCPDRSRVVTRLFVPGHEGFDHQDSRSGAVLARILALDDAEVGAAFEDVLTRFASRHRGLIDTFLRHADHLSGRLDPGRRLSDTRRLLLGAAFTSEYATEGAALCNPSIVAGPDQAGLPEGSLRFFMSVRGIGEGHNSSIGFRTGVIDAAGTVSLDDPEPFPASGRLGTVDFDADVFRRELDRRLGTNENADFVFDGLANRFTAAELEQQIARLEAQQATRTHTRRTINGIRAISARSYEVSFPADTHVSQRVLCPAAPSESHGMEDARFVRFQDDDGIPHYYATYTGYDGDDITLQLLATTDFRSFTTSPIFGAAAANKGLALFPRRIAGRFAAMCRSDRETNTVGYSEDLREWATASPCQVPKRSWEVLQLGNCGSPIETEAGWLLLTHGVGPMRTYSIGALLLDLDDPTRIIGQLRDPLLTPALDEQDGYVPNVVYSCGALVHDGTLVLPYGIGDAFVGVATGRLRDILDALVSPDRPGSGPGCA